MTIPERYVAPAKHVLFCEVCRKEFTTKEMFERGCFYCSPARLHREIPKPIRSEFDME